MIEPEPKTKPTLMPEPGFASHISSTSKPSDRRNSSIPVPTKPVENRRRSNVIVQPSQMVLRSRISTSTTSQPSRTSSSSSQPSSTSILSQRQANQLRTTRTSTTSSTNSQPSSTSVLSQRQAAQLKTTGASSSSTTSQYQRPVTRRSLLQTAPQPEVRVLTRRKSLLESQPEPPQPPKPPRRPSLFSNLPPFSLQMFKSASSKDTSEPSKPDPTLSRRYHTRSAQNQNC